MIPAAVSDLNTDAVFYPGRRSQSITGVAFTFAFALAIAALISAALPRIPVIRIVRLVAEPRGLIIGGWV